MNTIMLASSSPRRQELLRQAGLPFRAAPSRLVEELAYNEEPVTAAKRIAKEKLDVFLENEHSLGCHWALAADTFVAFNGCNYGKPADHQKARALLMLLSGNIHQVYTGLVLCNQRSHEVAIEAEITEVEFMALSEEDIDWYMDTGEWQDSAGGYKIQGKGQCLIKSIKGSYSNVLGLPLNRLYIMLRKLGYSIS